ncbi:PLD nuclease N-terminal domain-containing protein [Demequina lignilytica]|uniref:PLD nuclease N-terminal domain-containing protein n=1 Tax=Demequina lignilytica TaxID=3051663 RepID=A0AAW7M3R8_9MICO|nr:MULTISPECIES: PLD nuclease N-terminal domain-containing protein [unclassified Demequina]MDN4478021.1 PLD nuclease N-terminal domain-containing protein [Demequina sp. SYSU T00039-1]MDN4482899.1 PLD nuclease N-terminal domain-containing protein [Demequina sp. SYSU T0a273]MDN4488529.1 PLD nuclease N-terminal domain-containing protein [Demequina sp. SYSU T00039]MDN4489924.1 PLD nuclease N-terminal domain-containing protein [Demequina sp. SYSU T00068]
MFVRVVLPLLYLGLVVYALSDMLQRQEKRPYGFAKWAWTLAIVLLPYLGAILWILAARTGPSTPPATRREPVAPDDDPEYLAWLREQSKRKRGSSGA